MTLDPFNLVGGEAAVGPDGPWNTVTVGAFNGSQPYYFQVYPGGQNASWFLSSPDCKSFGDECGASGLYNTQGSEKFVNTSVYMDFKGPGGDKTYSVGAMTVDASVLEAADTLILTGFSMNKQHANIFVNNFSIAVLPPRFEVYLPNGNPYPLQTGQISLSSNVSYHFMGTGEQSLIPGSLAPNANKAKSPVANNKNNAQIPSNSCGLHQGTALIHPALNASVWLGAYDANRVLGPVSMQTPDKDKLMQINHLDIGIRVASGASPFPFQSKQGLLSSGNQSIGSSLPVWMNPQAPYLFLPRSVCDSITQDLPINYDASLDFYLWDTESPGFAKIVNSPAYMSLTFQAKGIDNASNITINMPYKLLNLTLQPPLVPSPMPYFPCVDPRMGGRYSLGRAFLQAAFIGANWDTGIWYLAQGPGPNISDTTSSTNFPAYASSKLTGSSVSWIDTWRGHLTPLPSPAGSKGSVSGLFDSSTRNSGRSEGAKAGIAVGVIVGVLALLSLGVFFLRRLSRGRNGPPPKIDADDHLALHHSVEGDFKHELAGHQNIHTQPFQKPELGGVSDVNKHKPALELPTNAYLAELDTISEIRHGATGELDGGSYSRKSARQ